MFQIAALLIMASIVAAVVAADDREMEMAKMVRIRVDDSHLKNTLVYLTSN